MNPADFETDERRLRVAVIVAPRDHHAGPRSAVEVKTTGPPVTPGHGRMLDGLETAFPVRFELADSTSPGGVDGVLVIGSGVPSETPADIPRLVVAAGDAPGCDSVTQGLAGGVSSASDRASLVTLADGPDITRELRGQTIHEYGVVGSAPLGPAGARTLASVKGRPVWWQLGHGAVAESASAYPLAELPDGGALRDYLRAGCFMGLLPLVHFIRQLLGARSWSPPPLRASFVIDDPNLHWPSYGYLDYRELGEHATRHHYHLGLATVPLDAWLLNRRAASLVARNPSVLSLVMHGNNHTAHELGRLDTDAEADAAIAQALRRIGALERRAGVGVERVMAPPYEDCSQPALRAMFRLGLEAACVCRPHPWRDGLPSATPLAGWQPAELVAGGIPVLPRYPLHADRDDLPLRALLGQPLILYAHHGDFAEGLDVLAQAACEINRLGDVQWGPLGWIARRSYETRTVDETLLVRMHARRVSVDVPAGIRMLQLQMPEPLGGASGHRVAHHGGTTEMVFEHQRGVSGPLRVEGPTRIALTLLADRPLGASQFGSPRTRPWLVIRRALAEGRDRAQAMH